tara:strand:- start:35 stop:475 length:441 start_codon:yes stop_codon:yes gene_type:complete
MSKINYFFEDLKPCKHQLPNKRWVSLCVAEEGRGVGCLNFIFCSDVYLKKINEKYLKKSYLTDVISFMSSPHNLGHTEEDQLVFGDVFISLERVKENKTTYKTTLLKELKRVMIHGVLHLMGYTDENKKTKSIMTKKENLYINLIN